MEGFLIDEKDEQAECERDHQRKRGVEQRKRLYTVQKVRLKDILKGRWNGLLYVDFLVYHAADRILGKGGSAEITQNL